MESLPVVLYVEDDPQSRKIMKMLFSGRMKLPHVTIFENSSHFLERAQGLDPKPTVVFLDIHMEPFTGFEMLGMLRALDWASHIPIIAITASVMQEEIHLLRTAGFDGCLAKPVDLSSFPEAFQHIVKGESVWRIVNH